MKPIASSKKIFEKQTNWQSPKQSVSSNKSKPLRSINKLPSISSVDDYNELVDCNHISTLKSVNTKINNNDQSEQTDFETYNIEFKKAIVSNVVKIN